jgi:hypothetical protein
MWYDLKRRYEIKSLFELLDNNPPLGVDKDLIVERPGISLV